LLGIGFTLLIGMVPAPSEIVEAIQEVEIETSSEVASVFRLRLGIAQTAIGDWTVLQHDLFRPLVPVSLRVLSGDGLPQAVINGYVSSLQATYADEPDQSTVEVMGMDATLLMNLQEKVMPWPNLSASAIAAAIFGQYAIVPSVEPTAPALVEPEGTTTQRGTDIRFLRRLAQRSGFECYVQPEPLSGVEMGHFRPPQLAGLPQAVLNVNFGAESNVSDFKVSYEMLRPTTVIAASVDVPTKAPQPAVAPVPVSVPLGLEPSLLRVLPPPVVRPAGTGLSRTAELQASAQAIVDRSSWAIVAEGTAGSDVGVLRPGGIVNVRGAGRVFNGSYYLTRVHHIINQEGYTQRFTARRNAIGMTGSELYVEL
jgi:phage protein D